MDSELLLSNGISTNHHPPKVFLSYAYPDRQVAQCIADALSLRGIDAWTDREITIGQSIASEVATKIAEADAIVVLMSPLSTKSQWVSTEIAVAIASTLEDPHKKVLPILIDGDSTESIPPLLFNHAYLDLRGNEQDSHKLDLLAAEILRRGTRKPTHYAAARELTEIETSMLRLYSHQQEGVSNATRSQAFSGILRGFVLTLVAIVTIFAAVLLSYDNDHGAWAATAINVVCLFGVALELFHPKYQIIADAVKKVAVTKFDRNAKKPTK